MIQARLEGGPFDGHQSILPFAPARLAVRYCPGRPECTATHDHIMHVRRLPSLLPLAPEHAIYTLVELSGETGCLYRYGTNPVLDNDLVVPAGLELTAV